MVLLGIPSSWQRLAVGLLLLVGIGAQALSAATGRRRRQVVAGEVPA
jgi:simple sugar transport system permease protein